MTPSEAIYLVNAVLSVFSPRAGYSGQDFDWADYHKQHGTEEAPPFGFRNVRSLVLATALFLDVVHRELCKLLPVREQDECAAVDHRILTKLS